MRLKTRSALFVITTLCNFGCNLGQRLQPAFLESLRVDQKFDNAAVRIPEEFVVERPDILQPFIFPTKKPGIVFGRTCYKVSSLRRFVVGSCVASSRCRSLDTSGSNVCSQGQVCCERRYTADGTTTQPPTSGASQLLKLECGKPKPNTIFFPFRQRLPTDINFSLRRDRRSALKHRNQVAEAVTLRPPVDPIVGGTDVPVTSALPVGDWPWMTLIGFFSSSGGIDWKCGGTLISASSILTAAHCVPNKQPADLAVRLGEYNITSTLDGPHTDVTISRIITHPGYRRSQNDIALLVLSKPVIFSNRIRPVCLPQEDADHTGAVADLAGWGRIGFAERTSNVLQEVSVKVVDEDDCEKAYINLSSFNLNFPGGFQGTKVCANGEDGSSRDACQGDSGGPLVVIGPDGKYQLIGVVSTGLGCGNPEFPGIYTKVSKYIPWIVSNAV